MAVTDPIADMLTRIRNAIQAGHPRVRIPHSKLKASIAGVLEEEGYIKAFEVRDRVGRAGADIEVELLYAADGRSMLSGLKRVSRPGSASTCSSVKSPAPTAGSAWPSSRRRAAS